MPNLPETPCRAIRFAQWRSVLVFGTFFLGAALTFGQIPLKRGYIRLGSRVIAIENPGTTSPPGGGSVRIDVWPSSSSLRLNQTLQLQAVVIGTTNVAVVWSCTPGGGTITSTGLFTAAAAISTGQTISIMATSVADPSKSAQVNLTFYSPEIAGSPGDDLPH